MADHWRKQIRDAIKAKLSSPALASVIAANVFTEDEYPREPGKFPGINITIGQNARERKGTVNAGGGVTLTEVENRAVVNVQAMVRQDTGCRDLLDQIGKEVEMRWLATPVDKGLGVQGCRDSECVAIGEPVFDNDSDILTAEQTTQFEVTVRSFEGRPDQS